MIEDGLKVGDSFGSDVTKIKYRALKGILSDLRSHARPARFGKYIFVASCEE